MPPLPVPRARMAVVTPQPEVQRTKMLEQPLAEQPAKVAWARHREARLVSVEPPELVVPRRSAPEEPAPVGSLDPAAQWARAVHRIEAALRATVGHRAKEGLRKAAEFLVAAVPLVKGALLARAARSAKAVHRTRAARSAKAVHRTRAARSVMVVPRVKAGQQLVRRSAVQRRKTRAFA